MFKFKSSGRKIDDPVFKKDIVDAERLIRPIGIVTPIEPGNDKSELFKMHTDPLEQLADNLRNLVQTNRGDRLGRFDIGCNLKSILFNRNSSLESDYEKEASQSIQEQISRYIPVINIDNITVKGLRKLDDTDRTSLAKAIIKIEFSVPILRRMNNSIEVVLYNAG